MTLSRCFPVVFSLAVLSSSVLAQSVLNRGSSNSSSHASNSGGSSHSSGGGYVSHQSTGGYTSHSSYGGGRSSGSTTGYQSHSYSGYGQTTGGSVITHQGDINRGSGYGSRQQVQQRTYRQDRSITRGRVSDTSTHTQQSTNNLRQRSDYTTRDRAVSQHVKASDNGTWSNHSTNSGRGSNQERMIWGVEQRGNVGVRVTRDSHGQITEVAPNGGRKNTDGWVNGNSHNWRGTGNDFNREFNRDRHVDLRDRVRRTDRITIYGGWRDGYCQYNRGWRDSDFFYSSYIYSPYDGNCVLSPWYYYPQLPGYLPYGNVVVLGGPYWNWSGYGTPYNYSPYNNGYNSYGNSELNYALNELTTAFQGNDTNAIGNLIPRDRQVSIYTDGQYMYSLNGDDFYQMLVDNIRGTQTRDYVITNVQRFGSSAQVTARHGFLDPWGNYQTIYHEYRLQYEGGNYVITDFTTSHAPILRNENYF